jgi:Toprim domain
MCLAGTTWAATAFSLLVLVTAKAIGPFWSLSIRQREMASSCFRILRATHNPYAETMFSAEWAAHFRRSLLPSIRAHPGPRLYLAMTRKDAATRSAYGMPAQTRAVLLSSDTWVRGNCRFPIGTVLRYHPALRIAPAIAAKHPELGLSGRTFPGLLALFRDIHTNAPSAVLRTFLTSNGGFIDRAMVGPVRGCAIKLDADENVTHGLHIGEGLETCLAAGFLSFWPIWALGNAGAIRTFPVLAGIECLNIIVDNDHNETGQQAARDCSARWTSAGREVRRFIPNISGQDFNDIITRKGKHAG